MGRPRICFIDDDEGFELPLFREVFGKRFDLLTAASYLAAREVIGARPGWRPDLFLLDLHFPFSEADSAKLSRLAAQPLTLPPDGGSLRQAYLNLRSAEQRLQELLLASGQGPEGGLRLAAAVRADFPGVPIAFYSRKATTDDFLRCMVEPGVVAIFFKPTGRDYEGTVALTRELAPALGDAIEACLASDEIAVAALKAACRLVLNALAKPRQLQGGPWT